VLPAAANARRIRRARELTQVEVASRIGISQSYLSALERGERPVPASRVQELARALRVPLSALLEGQAR
jgi:XRE family transcriptional regulator, fatty acid utilization regulator